MRELRLVSATTPRKVFKVSENGPAGVSLPDRFA
jgi:hypothetical protein